MGLHARHSSGSLRASPFFEGWTDDELEHFERIAERRRFPAGDVLIHERRPGQAFLILIAGEAEVSRAGRSLVRLGAGDSAGEMSLIDDAPASATVTAVADVEALVLSHRDFNNLLETLPSLGRRVLATLVRRIRDGMRPES